MASTNPDSMTNAQGEFKPSVPRDQPLETSGHQVGQMVGNDAAPEFHAKVLPAGSAPAKSTYQPNPINETPGQANNPDVQRSSGKDGKEATYTEALDMPGATSGDVNMGLGKPAEGESSAELHHDGQIHRKRDRMADIDTIGGSGMTDQENIEARRLQEEHTERGPRNAREHNVSLEGAESKEPTSLE